MRRALCATAAALALLALPATVAAHVQVHPATAAPGDPVLWTMLVPSEQEAGTERVELAIPAGVLPFSFEDAPGWTRTARRAGDGSLRSVVWRGRTTGDGLATFRFLASTPEREGRVAWKAIQTYRDGTVVRWIGSSRAEYPASVTTINRSAPRENAGGEGAAAADGSVAAGAGIRGGSGDGLDGGDGGGDDGGPDWLARGLALAALLAAGGIGITSTLARGRRRA